MMEKIRNTSDSTPGDYLIGEIFDFSDELLKKTKGDVIGICFALAFVSARIGLERNESLVQFFHVLLSSYAKACESKLIDDGIIPTERDESSEAAGPDVDKEKTGYKH